MNVKITKLTPLNVEALNEMAPRVTGLVEVTKTTATFVGVTAGEALRMVQRMQDVAADTYGKTGGPYASLHAVVRKVNALAAAEIREAQARSEARAEADAASDPLVVLLNDTTPMPADSSELADLAAALETTVEELAGSVHVMRDGGVIITPDSSESQAERDVDDAFAELKNLERRRAAVVGLGNDTGLTYGATIRPKAWVTAHVDSEPVRERAYRSKPGAGRVGGRLLVKCGRRRNRG
jgi:SepF-like predicted cell division protein (DUF552 family)